MMKKLFAAAAAVLASFGLMAQAVPQSPILAVTAVPMTYAGSVDTPPTIAAQVGYTVNTFNSTTLGTTVGSVFQNLGFYGSSTPATQNADGSITVAGVTTDPQIGTAQHDSSQASPYQFDGIAFGCGAYVQATLSWPVGTGNPYGNIATLGNLVGGSGYTNGSYTNVPLVDVTSHSPSANGSGAIANIVVSGGAVQSVTLTPTGYGTNFVTNDILNVASGYIGSGSGFQIQVTEAFRAWPALWAFDAESMSTNTINSANQWPGLSATLTAGSSSIGLNFDPTNVFLTQTSATTWNAPLVVFSGANTGSVTGVTLGSIYYAVGGTTSSIQISATNGGSPITLGGSGTASVGLVYGDFIEWDLQESDITSTSQFAFPSALHNWMGYVGSSTSAGARTNSTTFPNTFGVNASTYWLTPHRYAGLWVPATSSSQGYLKEYLDGTFVKSVFWNQYSASNPPPPAGTATGAIMDQRHLLFLINGTATMPVTVRDFEVWQSPTAAATCNITQDTTGAAATPTFNVGGGTYTSPQTVNIQSATSGTTIYYTTDGSTPTTSSTVYSGALTVSVSETLKALATKSGLTNSGIGSATYTISATAATPSIGVSGSTATITDSTPGSTIYYTTDGSTPTPGSGTTLVYTGPITASQAVTPTFSPAAGTYGSTQSVTITSPSGGTIYYTTDGSTPTYPVSGTTQTYTGAISVSSSETLNAIVIVPGMAPSAIGTAAYTIT